MVICLDEKATRLEKLHDHAARFPCLFASNLFQYLRKNIRNIWENLGLFIEHFDSGEVRDLTQSRLVVVEIVGRRHFYRTSAEFEVNENRVADDRNLTRGQRQINGLADEIFIPWIERMNGNRHVAKHGFRPRGCYSETNIVVMT